jgi:hypothetical protein
MQVEVSDVTELKNKFKEGVAQLQADLKDDVDYTHLPNMRNLSTTHDVVTTTNDILSATENAHNAHHAHSAAGTAGEIIHGVAHVQDQMEEQGEIVEGALNVLGKEGLGIVDEHHGAIAHPLEKMAKAAVGNELFGLKAVNNFFHLDKAFGLA